MEFWGVEVKSGVPFKVTPGLGKVLHLSQACIGEVKKDKTAESVYLSVNVDGTKLVLGTLFTDKLPQQQFDLVFDRYFEISHNWKNGSVYFYGYMADNTIDEEFSEEDSDESEEDIPSNIAINGKPDSKPKQLKTEETGKTSAAKAKVSESANQLAKKNVNSKENDEFSDDDLMSEDDDDSDDDEDEDDDSDDSDEETPKKDVLPSKKRVAEPSSKTPVQEKKAKLNTQKTGVHVATPHPSKQATKKTSDEKPNQSGGANSCSSCNRTFGSEKALESHNKAKHSTGK